LADHPFAPEIQAVAMTPCWTVMAAFTQPISAAWDGAFVHHSSLGWVARNSSKPGRNASAECWVFQATAAWSTAHLETPRAEIPALLLAEFQRLVGSELPPTTYLEAHRWMYSATATQSEKNTISEQRVLFDPARKLAVCGDWICGGRVEGAFLSGLAAADAASA
jgi:predicted NAD/FAD-dependent oxidoreductase